MLFMYHVLQRTLLLPDCVAHTSGWRHAIQSGSQSERSLCSPRSCPGWYLPAACTAPHDLSPQAPRQKAAAVAVKHTALVPCRVSLFGRFSRSSPRVSSADGSGTSGLAAAAGDGVTSKRALFEQWQKVQPPPQDPASPLSGKPRMPLGGMNRLAYAHSTRPLTGCSAAPACRIMLLRPASHTCWHSSCTFQCQAALPAARMSPSGTPHMLLPVT